MIVVHLDGNICAVGRAEAPFDRPSVPFGKVHPGCLVINQFKAGKISRREFPEEAATVAAVGVANPEKIKVTEIDLSAGKA